MSQQLTEQPEERRRYCRIDDGVILRYRIIPEAEIPADIEQLDAGLPNRFTLTSTFAATTQQMEPLLRKIQEQSLEVGEYLRLLDRKLDLVARAFLLQEINVYEEPTCRVNLSAGGIGFYAETPLPVGAALEIELILIPSYTGILSYGRVVYRRHDPGAEPGLPYRVGVEFCKMREKDRDLFVKHVLGKESESRRRDMATGIESNRTEMRHGHEADCAVGTTSLGTDSR